MSIKVYANTYLCKYFFMQRFIHVEFIYVKIYKQKNLFKIFIHKNVYFV